ncbi:MAG: choice-of-anchor D domain-containing protein [Deltaproteobacteria bacterium]|nr:choice-of-anchor D domain-containing protein [Deltaproteobacteria bacterium]
MAEPLDHWQLRAPLPQGHSLGISYGNGIFVAVGESGSLYTSSEGAAWKERSSGANQSLHDAVYGGGTFVAVGTSGTILTSPDGITWTLRSSGTGHDLNGVGYGHGIFVAVGDHGAILTSPDGVSWAARDSGTHQWLKKVAYGGGTFVAAGGNGTLLTSPDGAAWTLGNSGTRGHLEGIAYGKKTFVAVGDTILTSPDGIGWTERTAGTSHRLFGVAYGSGVFAAVADNGAILTSSDGSEWTPRDSGTHLTLYGIAHGRKIFLAAGEKGILLQSESLPSPQISVSSTSLDFGSVDVGDSSFTNLTVTNSGSADLIIGQLTLSGADMLDFNTRNDNCTRATVAPSQNCTIQIVFSPRSTGSKSATLSISSNDPDTPTQTVSLSGSGTGDAVIIASGSTGSVCFFSSSTKGTGVEDYLDVLRKFRDVILLRSHLGETLVDFYYQHSPALARVLARHEWLRKAVAFSLVPPLAAIAYVTLYTSPAEKAILFFLMAGGVAAGCRLIRRLGKNRISRCSAASTLGLTYKASCNA